MKRIVVGFFHFTENESHHPTWIASGCYPTWSGRDQYRRPVLCVCQHGPLRRPLQRAADRHVALHRHGVQNQLHSGNTDIR